MKFELSEISGNVVQGRVLQPGRNLTKIAHDYVGYPKSMPCRSHLCLVESEVSKAGDSWEIAFKLDPEALEAVRSGQGEINVELGDDGLAHFSVVPIGEAEVEKNS